MSESNLVLKPGAKTTRRTVTSPNGFVNIIDETDNRTMSEETKPTEPTPDIAALFEAFCKQHGVTFTIAAEAPVTGHLIPAVNILAMRWPLKIVFEKTQG